MNGIRQFLFFTGTFLLASLFVNGQQVPYEYDYSGNGRIISNSQMRRMARHAMRERDYFTAIDVYKEYLKRVGDDRKATFQLAEAYRMTRDYRSALQTYLKSYELDRDKNLLALYFLARMKMTQEEYQSAIEDFELFRKKFRNKKDDTDYRRRAKTWIEGCELALLDSVAEENVRLKHLEGGINMAYNEFAPRPYSEDQMLFASLRSDTIIHFEDSLFQDTSAFRSSLHLGKEKSGEWVYDGRLNGPFEKNDAHISNPCLSLDSSKLYFTVCRKNWKYETVCHIYFSELIDGTWGEPVKMNDNINYKKSSASQPAVGFNPRNGNEILFFTSNREGGRGGFDLWYSEKKRGTFSEARNLGGRINTRGDEFSPFFDPENSALYFSSDGHPSYGEQDIFMSFGNKSKWMKNPENLGKPINSPADDLYYSIYPDAKSGFITSNREGGLALKNPTCCDDIYEFKYVKVKRFTYKAIVQSDDPEYRISSGEVQVYLRDEESGDTTYLKRATINKKSELSLRVNEDLHYLLLVESPDHFVQAIEIPPGGKKFDFSKPDTIRVTKLTDQSFVLKNIYYPFDEWYLTEKAQHAIDSFLLKILILNPEIKVEISSHTDSKGSGEYNIRLSQKRAESVVQYLKRKGITSSRMVPKGYGKTKPIAPNTNADGSDNPEGRQLNRRTEFRVIGFDKEVKYKKVPTGKFVR